MMYQRDMVCFTYSNMAATHPNPLPRRGRTRLTEEAQQELDDLVENGVDAEEEDGEQRGHDDDHDAGRHRFLAGRPDDLARFVPDLAEELRGGGFRHLVSLLGFRIE